MDQGLRNRSVRTSRISHPSVRGMSGAGRAGAAPFLAWLAAWSGVSPVTTHAVKSKGSAAVVSRVSRDLEWLGGIQYANAIELRGYVDTSKARQGSTRASRIPTSRAMRLVRRRDRLQLLCTGKPPTICSRSRCAPASSESVLYAIGKAIRLLRRLDPCSGCCRASASLGKNCRCTPFPCIAKSYPCCATGRADFLRHRLRWSQDCCRASASLGRSSRCTQFPCVAKACLSREADTIGSPPRWRW